VTHGRGGLEVNSLVVDRAAAPSEQQHLEGLVEQRIPLLEIDPERLVFLAQEPGACPQDESPAREDIERRGVLASRNGLRYGTTVTLVSNRIRLEAPAATARPANGSSAS
jgi:hypothetical protein